MNEVLEEATQYLKGVGCIGHDPIIELLEISDQFDYNLIFFDQEFVSHCQNEDRNKKLVEKQKEQDLELKRKLSKLIDTKEFERAARVRDERIQLRRDIFKVLMNELKFKEGFNLHKDSLVIVTPEDTIKEMIILKFLSMRKEKHFKPDIIQENSPIYSVWEMNKFNPEN